MERSKGKTKEASVVALAYSGGADSTALLWRMSAEGEKKRGFKLWALHARHGEPWEKECEELARTEALRAGAWFKSVSIAPLKGKGESWEANARLLRYGALARMSQEIGAEEVSLGHTMDDQAETFLLMALRGSGWEGLSAMGEEMKWGGVRFVRPLLGARGKDLRAELLRAGRIWFEDPSNQDESFARNKIRARLMPLLDELFPGAAQALSRSARLAQEGSVLLKALAKEDQALHGAPSEAWLGMEDARLANALRVWLKESGAKARSAQINEIIRQGRHGGWLRASLRARAGKGEVVARKEGTGGKIFWMPDDSTNGLCPEEKEGKRN